MAFSHDSSCGPHEIVYNGRHLFVVEPFLRLPLEQRVAHKDRENADQPFADVVGRDDQSLGFDLMRGHEIANRLDDAGLETTLMSAARRRADAVDVGADRLVGRFGPLHGDFDLVAVLAHQLERRLRNLRLSCFPR